MFTLLVEIFYNLLKIYSKIIHAHAEKKDKIRVTLSTRPYIGSKYRGEFGWARVE